MAKKVKKMVKLIFPQHLIKEPITYKVALRYKIIPNIRRAKVTETVGELVLELTGEEKKLKHAIKYLKKIGVEVYDIEGDILD
jgi:ABC-type methionine transport system ATPase subunit